MPTTKPRKAKAGTSCFGMPRIITRPSAGTEPAEAIDREPEA